MMLAQLVNMTFNLVFWIIILTIFLSWIPNVDWQNPILRSMRAFTDAILSPLRGVIPPVSGLDLSPIVVLILLQLIQAALVQLCVYIGV